MKIQTHKKKRIYLNKEKTRYCVVRLYGKKTDMHIAYAKSLNESGCQEAGEVVDPFVQGAHVGYKRIRIHDDGSEELNGETGQVFLHFGHAGAGTVSHELLHAVLWAWKHQIDKEQYPIVINSMEEEEEILYAHTDAVNQFYTWYWKVEAWYKSKSN
jgi:hypothetical protein